MCRCAAIRQKVIAHFSNLGVFDALPFVGISPLLHVGSDAPYPIAPPISVNNLEVLGSSYVPVPGFVSRGRPAKNINDLKTKRYKNSKVQPVLQDVLFSEASLSKLGTVGLTDFSPAGAAQFLMANSSEVRTELASAVNNSPILQQELMEGVLGDNMSAGMAVSVSDALLMKDTLGVSDKNFYAIGVIFVRNNVVFVPKLVFFFSFSYECKEGCGPARITAHRRRYFCQKVSRSDSKREVWGAYGRRCARRPLCDGYYASYHHAAV
jgi:hypothetical protein